MKTAANAGYRNSMPNGAVLRNPDLGLPSNFSKSGGVTFSRVSVPGPYVALTFDDGPHASNTPRLLDILRARNVKATFYVIGKNVDLYPNIVRRTVAEGHEIGNHTYNHPKLSSLGQDRVFAEIRKCDDAIMRAAGVRPRTLRPLWRSDSIPAHEHPLDIRLPYDHVGRRSPRLETSRRLGGDITHC